MTLISFGFVSSAKYVILSGHLSDCLEKQTP